MTRPSLSRRERPDGGRSQLPTVISPAPRDVWRELTAGEPRATVFQTLEWLTCICDVEGYVDASRLYHTSAGRRLLLPVVRYPSLSGRLASEASLPRFWGACGLVSDGELHEEDVREILTDLASTAGLLMSVRPYFTQAGPWEKTRPPEFTT